MANEKRLISESERADLIRCLKKIHNCDFTPGVYEHSVIGRAALFLEETADAVEVPCKIGDFVWAIRSFKGHKQPQRGIVGDMFFTKDMKLMIVVKYVARGEWGKTVFATDKEAYAAIGERKDEA